MIRLVRARLPGLLVFAACAIGQAWPLLAQTRTGTYRETSEVSVVEVPVQVVGRDGKPVKGLQASDFEIEEDGRRQTITSVDVVSIDRAIPVAAGQEPPASARRHFLFLFDFTFATSNEIARSRDAAIRFVDGGMAPDDFAGVATVSAEGGLSLQLTFTSDRRQIASTLKGIGLPTAVDRSRDPLAFAFSTSGDARLVLEEGYASKSTAVDSTSTLKVLAAVGRRVSDDYMLTRVVRHLSDMSGLARALDLVDGRKTVLYFSEGFDGRLIFGSLGHEVSPEQTAADNDAMMSGASWSIDVDRRYANTPMQRQLADTAELLRRSDCTVYPIDIAGLRDASDGTLGQGERGEDFLFALAQGTGGEVIRNSNDIAGQIERVQKKTSLTYVLTYSTNSPAGPPRYHSLRVHTNVKGARVSARAGYFDRASFRAMTPLQRVLSAGNAIAHEKEVGDFTPEVLAFALATGKVSRMPVVIGIPSAALVGRDAGGRAHLEIFAYVFDSRGQVVDSFTRNTTIGGELLADRVLFTSTCHVSPGHYRVRVFVRNALDGRSGFHALTVDVPDWSSEKMKALVPLFLDTDGHNVLLREGGSRPEEADPFSFGGASFVPQVAPTLAPGVTSHLCLMLVRNGAPQRSDSFQVDVAIVDGEGRSFTPIDLHVIGRTEPSPDGLVRVFLDFSLPKVRAGRYLLKVTFRDSLDRSVESRSETAFRVS